MNLFTRPRRFGKSLNMSMLKYFFEYGCDSRLFDELEIAGKRELCEEYMGSFPVISVILKDVCARDFETTRDMLKFIIGNEAMRFQFLLDSGKLSMEDKAQQSGYYDEMVTMIRNLLSQALKTNASLHFAVLTGCLRIAKESIFTELNNLRVISITNMQFG